TNLKEQFLLARKEFLGGGLMCGQTQRIGRRFFLGGKKKKDVGGTIFLGGKGREKTNTTAPTEGCWFSLVSPPPAKPR
ncbi:hypothetical protein, partial [Escherichia coli]|uniref:hypothetical protein n=1 Tax=Escherichia coli TaxID=562 RepID=UPI0021C987A6